VVGQRRQVMEIKPTWLLEGMSIILLTIIVWLTVCVSCHVYSCTTFLQVNASISKFTLYKLTIMPDYLDQLTLNNLEARRRKCRKQLDLLGKLDKLNGPYFIYPLVVSVTVSRSARREKLISV